LNFVIGVVTNVSFPLSVYPLSVGVDDEEAASEDCSFAVSAVWEHAVASSWEVVCSWCGVRLMQGPGRLL